MFRLAWASRHGSKVTCNRVVQKDKVIKPGEVFAHGGVLVLLRGPGEVGTRSTASPSSDGVESFPTFTEAVFAGPAKRERRRKFSVPAKCFQ